MAIVAPKKEVKEHFGRAKALLAKGETIKGLFETCEGLRKYILNIGKFIGTEKLEVEDLARDVLQYLCVMQDIQSFLDAPIVFKRGSERQTHAELVALVKRIAECMQKGSVDEEAQRRQERQQHKDKLLGKLQDYLRDRDMVKAAGQFKKVMEDLEGEPGLLTDVAETYYKTGMHAEAVELALKAIQKNAKDMSAYRIAVNAFRCQKEYGKALAVYKQALKVFGHHPNIYLNMGRIFYEMGSFGEAATAVKAALKLEPDNEEASALLKEVQKNVSAA